MVDKIVEYYENIGREDTAKRITEDPKYAAKMKKLWDKRKAKKEQREYHEDMEGTGFKGGGRAIRGLGKAFMKGGKV